MAKRKVVLRILRALFILAAVSCLTVLLINWSMVRSGKKYITGVDTAPECDAVIILGAYVFPDGKVSDMLADRLNKGLEVYNAKKAPKIVVSGDHGRKEYDEVNGMREFLEAKGVPRENIFMDHAGFSTYDSLYRARDVFLIKRTIIVTQEYHLTRALYTAKKLGLEAYGVPARDYEYPGMEYYRLREYAARIKAFLQAGIFKPEPKYLGDAIPIWGSGLMTDDGK